jgi:hypothetical protein
LRETLDLNIPECPRHSGIDLKQQAITGDETEFIISAISHFSNFLLKSGAL